MIYTTVFFHFYKCKLPEARRSETSKQFIGDSLKKRNKAMAYNSGVSKCSRDLSIYLELK